MNEIVFPAGDPAAAVLRPRGRRRGQLRRHRRGHRPRDRPRLRRPGLAVRRRRATCSDWWTEPTDKARSTRSRQAADRAVRRASSRATLPGRARQRRADRRREHRRPRRPDDRLQGLRGSPRGRASAGARRPHRRAAALPRAGRTCWRTKARDEEADAQLLAVDPHSPAGVPRQRRAQPRRVPRGVRRQGGRRALARPRGRASGSGDAGGRPAAGAGSVSRPAAPAPARSARPGGRTGAGRSARRAP